MDQIARASKAVIRALALANVSLIAFATTGSTTEYTTSENIVENCINNGDRYSQVNDVLNRLFDIESGYVAGNDVEDDIINYPDGYVPIFNSSRSLFLNAELKCGMTLKKKLNTEVQYSILPMPKFDVAQKNYISECSNNTLMMAIPVTNSDAEAAGLALDTGDTVYKSIKATVNGETITYEAEKDFGAEYISAVVIYNIPKDAGALQISVLPSVTFTDSRGTMNGAVKSASVDYWSEETLSTMTFNIRNWDTSDAHLERIKTVIKENTPDVIGFQEMSNLSGKEWVDKLFADSEINAMYGYIGEERTDGTGEQCAIFYRKDKFSVMANDVFYLYCAHGVHCTNTSCKGVDQPGNFSNAPTDAYNRLFTYARLRRISDEKELIYINTHLETSTPAIDGVKLQTKEIDYIINFAKDWIDEGYSVILTGDFNANLESAVAQKIFAAGYKNASQASAHVIGGELPTGERYESGNKSMVSPGIDQIFIHSNTCYFGEPLKIDSRIKILRFECEILRKLSV